LKSSKRKRKEEKTKESLNGFMKDKIKVCFHEYEILHVILHVKDAIEILS